MRKIVIFDIDGTLADNSERRELLTGEYPDWDVFFEKMGEDKPIEPIANLFSILYNSGKYLMCIFSGRPERFRVLTEQWLTWNGIAAVPLFMRKNGDHRPDDIVKEEMLHSLIADGESIEFVVDDRQAVVDMWRKNGIICLQCAEGNF